MYILMEEKVGMQLLRRAKVKFQEVYLSHMSA